MRSRSQRQNGTRVVLASTLAAALLAFILPWHGVASTPSFACTPGRSYYQYPNGDSQLAGMLNAGRTSGLTIGGVYAQIENVNATAAGPYSDETLGWDMLTNGTYWAQIGWAEGTMWRHTFSQVYEPGYFNTWFNAPQPLGSYPYYTVLYDNTPGTFTFQINSNPWTPAGSGGYDPPANFAPNEAQAAEEIHNRQDQMGGTVSSTAGYYDLHIYKSGGWVNPTDGIMFNYMPVYFGTDPVANYGPYYNSQFYVWDKGCP